MKKIRSNDCIILIFAASFIIYDFFRRFIICNLLKVDNTFLGYVNYLFYILLFIVILIKIKYKMYENKYIYAFIFIQVLFLINFKINGYPIERYFYEQVFVILPILLIGIKISNSDFEDIFPFIIKSINILVISIVITGVLDSITQSGVQKYLASHNFFESMLNYDLLNQMGVYRYFSFYGHPLRVAQMVIIFYILNAINYEYFNKSVNMLFISIISIIGVILTSSKAGMIILLALMIINTNICKKVYQKVIFNISIFVTLIFILSSKAFEKIVLSRLVGIDFSSGRNDIFEYIKSGILPYPNLIGRGVDYTGYLLSTIKTNISSFEYPFLIFSYECGILITLILYFCLLYPIIKMLIRKQYKICIYFIAITGIINIYNGITVMGDYMIQYCFLVMLFKNISGYLEGKYEKKSSIYNR